jgi:hypothetical protein
MQKSLNFFWRLETYLIMKEVDTDEHIKSVMMTIETRQVDLLLRGRVDVVLRGMLPVEARAGLSPSALTVW